MSASRASESRPSGRPSDDGGDPLRRRQGPARSGASVRAQGVLPEGGLPCVWMTAGLIAWKLCDRQYDCEHCPLDAALGGEHAPLSPAEQQHEHHPHLEFPADRRYSASHGWVQASDGRLRLGLDALVVRLLDQVSSVVLPAVGSHTRRGEPLCWLVDDGLPFPLASPLTGTVRCVNARLQADPSLFARSPYEEGWLLELAAAEPDLEQHKDLCEAAEQRKRTARHLRDLHSRGARLAQRTQGVVGPTLCDGGQPVRGMRRLLGTPAYHRLVHRILG